MALKQLKKMRLIKITEKQLREVEGFNYFSGSDTPNGDGNTHISVGGRYDGDEMAKPIDSDDIASSETANSYNRYYDRSHGIVRKPLRCGIGESKDLDGDFDNNGIKDNAETPEFDDNPNNDIVQIPQGVEQKEKLLAQSVQGLTPKQQGVVLKKFTDDLNLKGLMPSQLRNLRLNVQ